MFSHSSYSTSPLVSLGCAVPALSISRTNSKWRDVPNLVGFVATIEFLLRVKLVVIQVAAERSRCLVPNIVVTVPLMRLFARERLAGIWVLPKFFRLLFTPRILVVGNFCYVPDLEVVVVLQEFGLRICSAVSWVDFQNGIVTILAGGRLQCVPSLASCIRMYNGKYRI